MNRQKNLPGWRSQFEVTRKAWAAWGRLVEFCSMATLLACSVGPMAPVNPDGSQTETAHSTLVGSESLRGTDGRDSGRSFRGDELPIELR